MCPSVREMISEIRKIVDSFVVEYSKHVPLLAIDWSDKLESWADK
jgi:hypothetical protein